MYTESAQLRRAGSCYSAEPVNAGFEDPVKIRSDIDIQLKAKGWIAANELFVELQAAWWT